MSALAFLLLSGSAFASMHGKAVERSTTAERAPVDRAELAPIPALDADNALGEAPAIEPLQIDGDEFAPPIQPAELAPLESSQVPPRSSGRRPEDAGRFSPSKSIPAEIKARGWNGADVDLVVIGAGSAGVSAAERAESLGLRVALLEKEGRVGGRAHSFPEGGFVQDIGGQFVVSHYDRALELMRKAGIADELIPLRSSFAILRQGKWRQIRLDDAMTIYDSGLIGRPADWMPRTGLLALNPWTAWVPIVEAGVRYWSARSVQAAWKIVRAFKAAADESAGHSPVRYRDWRDLDTGNAARWAQSHYGEDGADYLLDPLYSGLFFKKLGETADDQLKWIIGNAARRDQWSVMKRGLQSIPEAVAQRLRDLRLNTTVTKVHRAEDGMYEIETDRGRVRSKAVVVAVPPPQAASFLEDPAPMQRRLMANDYASTIVLNLNLRRPLQGALAGSFMALIPTVERVAGGAVAAWSIESGKGKDTLGRDVLGVHLTAEGARRLWDLPEDELISRVLRELEAYVSGLSSHVDRTFVKYWVHAIPHSRPGWSAFLDEFWRWQETHPELGIYFAGDGTTFATLGAAMQSGADAADLASRSIRRR